MTKRWRRLLGETFPTQGWGRRRRRPRVTFLAAEATRRVIRGGRAVSPGHAVVGGRVEGRMGAEENAARVHALAPASARPSRIPGGASNGVGKILNHQPRINGLLA